MRRVPARRGIGAMMAGGRVAWTLVVLLAVGAGVRAGLVGQRTRVYEGPREVQPGLLVGFRFKRAEIAAHVFDSDESAPLYVLFVGFEFEAR